MPWHPFRPLFGTLLTHEVDVSIRSCCNEQNRNSNFPVFELASELRLELGNCPTARTCSFYQEHLFYRRMCRPQRYQDLTSTRETHPIRFKVLIVDDAERLRSKVTGHPATPNSPAATNPYNHVGVPAFFIRLRRSSAMHKLRFQSATFLRSRQSSKAKNAPTAPSTIETPESTNTAIVIPFASQSSCELRLRVSDAHPTTPRSQQVA